MSKQVLIVVVVKTKDGMQIVNNDDELLEMLVKNKDAEVHRLHYREDLGKFDDEILSRDEALDELNSGISLVYNECNEEAQFNEVRVE